MERQSGECGGDVAAYLLGALSPEEAERFRRHLENCHDCRDEVTELRATVAALPLSAPQLEAPVQLRRRVLSTVRAEARAQQHGARVPTARGRWATRRLTPAFAGAAVALAAVSAVLLVLLTGGTSVRVYRAAVSVRGAQATLRVGSGTPELVVSGMPAPPAGKVYEVWVARPRQAPAPTDALFDVNASGSAAVALRDLRGVQAVMVTAEPLGGSRKPTSKPVIVARLS